MIRLHTLKLLSAAAALLPWHKLLAAASSSVLVLFISAGNCLCPHAGFSALLLLLLIAYAQCVKSTLVHDKIVQLILCMLGCL
jgi:hypothetical protein